MLLVRRNDWTRRSVLSLGFPFAQAFRKGLLLQGSAVELIDDALGSLLPGSRKSAISEAAAASLVKYPTGFRLNSPALPPRTAKRLGDFRRQHRTFRRRRCHDLFQQVLDAAGVVPGGRAAVVEAVLALVLLAALDVIDVEGPVAAFSWLIGWSRNLFEALVQGQVVSN